MLSEVLLSSSPEIIDALEKRYAQTAKSKGFTYVPKNLKARIGNQERVIFCYYSAEMYGVLVYLLTDKKVMVSKFQSPKLIDFVEVSLADIEDVFTFANNNENAYTELGTFHNKSDLSIKIKNQVLATIIMPRGNLSDIEQMRVQIINAKTILD